MAIDEWRRDHQVVPRIGCRRVNGRVIRPSYWSRSDCHILFSDRMIGCAHWTISDIGPAFRAAELDARVENDDKVRDD
jgi:hypothetical protein